MINLIISLSLNFAPAQTVMSSEPLSSGSPLKAYGLARETKWPEARNEAEGATKSNPNDAKAWFILGVAEERLENLSAAVIAFDKYLTLTAATPAAKAVRDELPAIKNRSKLKDEDTYGITSNGFFIEKSLGYAPAYVAEFHGKFSTPIGFGFNFGKVYLGYRQLSGTFTEDLKLPDASSPPVYSAVSGGGNFMSRQGFANINVSLVDPYTSWGDMQLAMPIYLGFGTNTLKMNSTGRFYGNWTYDMGLGLVLRGYTRSMITWYVQGIYHLGIPFWGFKEWGTDDVIRNAADESIKGSTSGFDTTVGISFLFGAETKKHY